MPIQVSKEDTLPKEHTNSLKKPQAPAVPEDDGFTRYSLINRVTLLLLINSGGAKDYNILHTKLSASQGRKKGQSVISGRDPNILN